MVRRDSNFARSQKTKKREILRQLITARENLLLFEKRESVNDEKK